MANPWFRLYSEFQDDPDIQMLSEAMQRRFIMLLCSRCKIDALSDAVIAFQWRLSPADVAETKEIFLIAGFIDQDWNVLAWNKRQFISDDVSARVAKFRNKANVTPMKRYMKQNRNVGSNTPEQNRTETDPTDITWQG